MDFHVWEHPIGSGSRDPCRRMPGSFSNCSMLTMAGLMDENMYEVVCKSGSKDKSNREGPERQNSKTHSRFVDFLSAKYDALCSCR